MTDGKGELGRPFLLLCLLASTEPPARMKASVHPGKGIKLQDPVFRQEKHGATCREGNLALPSVSRCTDNKRLIGLPEPYSRW